MERLLDHLDFDNNRFLFLHGEGVQDCFISSDYREMDILESLWRVLKASRFDYILFYSHTRRIFFLDEASHAYCLPDNSLEMLPPEGSQKEQENRFFSSGPMGRRVALPRRPSPPASRRASGNADSVALELMNWLMEDTTHRSAVVISQAETSFHYFSMLGPQAGRLGSWASLPLANRNLCILLFASLNLNKDMEDNHEFIPIPEISAYLAGSRDIQNSRCELKVPGPENAEALRILDYSRLTKKKPITWGERDRMAEMIAADGKTARRWLQALNRMPRLDITSLQSNLESRRRGGSGLPWREALDRLEGLSVIKQRVTELEAYVKDRRERLQMGMLSPQTPSRPLHLVFLGNPGTGKTTVADLIGEMYRDLGLLKKGHVIKVEAKDLIKQYEGHTRIHTNEMVDKALDGVLFIDEAHQLTERDDPFGKEAVSVILTRMENDRDRLAVIVAGYTNKMKAFLKSDPGLPSRFPEENHLLFPDYNPNELMNILMRFLADKGLKTSPAFDHSIREVVENMYKERDEETFGNARKMRELAESIESTRATRRSNLRLPVDTLLEPDDISTVYQRYLLPSNPEMKELMAELNTLVGLENVKTMVEDLAYKLQVDKVRRERGKKVQQSNMNLCFVGNPGTGKTRVALMLGKIFKAVGRLRKDYVKRIRTSELIAGYLGQTSEKAEKAIKEALDGVLFLDEAYELDPGNPPDKYKEDAIGKIMEFIDLYSDRLVVVLAGYPEQMKGLIESNPGLARRVPNVIHFEDYSDEELLEILYLKAAELGVHINPDSLPGIRTYFQEARRRDGVRFGNAAVVDGLIEQMQKSQNRRFIASGIDSILESFEPQDVPGVHTAEERFGNPPGYRHYDLSSRLVPAESALTNTSAISAVGLVQVMEAGGEGSGTGFVVTPEGHVLTAYHVVAKATQISFRLDGTEKNLDAEIVGLDEQADLAVLRLPYGPSYPWLPLAEAGSLPAIGEEIVVLGYPLGKQFGEEITLVNGLVSSLRAESGMVQISAPVTHGSSGGPVCRKSDLRVVGVIHGGANQPGALINFASNIQFVYVRFSQHPAQA